MLRFIPPSPQRNRDYQKLCFPLSLQTLLIAYEEFRTEERGAVRLRDGGMEPALQWPQRSRLCHGADALGAVDGGLCSLRLLSTPHLLQLPQGLFSQSCSSSEAVILFSLKLDAWQHLSIHGVSLPCYWYTQDISSKRAAQELPHTHS